MHVQKNTFQIFWLIFAISFIFGNCQVLGGQWQVLRPDEGSGTRQILQINKNEWSYYRLEPGDEMSFSIPSDEGDIRIITRADPGRKTKGDMIYNFRIGTNGNKGRLFSRATQRAKSVKVKGNRNKVGAKRTIEFNNDNMITSLTLSIDDTAKFPIYFRTQIEREEFAETVPYISFSPDEYVNTYDINTNEIVSKYYTVDSSRVLSVFIIGPTVLKINARLLMDDSMRGSQKRGIQVFEDEKLKNTFPLSFRASHVSTVLLNTDIIPSRADKFFIEVPKGQHVYNFSILDCNGTIILRFFIPENDLTNDLHQADIGANSVKTRD
ncbi:MAG: hypothetical protein P9L92_03900 [Candidatus Electryonea clarkiae]|nr:hypothetical protein [Candidatus Electryonea clarkiae]